MASASAVGFLRPAKRAAFGDVTNVNRASSVAVGAKPTGVKPQAHQLAVQRPPTGTKDKENSTHSRKDSLKGGLQRASAAAVAILMPRASNHSQPVEVIQPLHDIPTQPQRLSESATIVSLTSAVPQKPQSSEAPRLHQPRHYKSQPQLKQQKVPVLRKTQSKQFDRIEPLSHVVVEPLVQVPDFQAGAPGTAITTDLVHEVSSSTLYHDANTTATDLEPLMAVTQAHYVDPSVNCISIAQSMHNVPASFKESAVTPALSEPEEFWDEDDDGDYDDQDQAYTTAHSYKSRDLTTGNVTTMLGPRVTNKVQKELDDARREVEATTSPDELEEEFWDVTMVAEYGEDIFEYLRELEIKMLPNPHYMESQTEIQWSMRSVLMDWLVQVHSRFNLLPETLFLTVNYIDRFLSCKVVSVGKLQLVGATAILLAAKYEEIHCPSLEEIEYMVDNGYSADEILKAERFMLSMLSFELGWPGPMSFLRRVSKADNYDLDTRTLAKYFIELTIMDERFVATPPSFLAAGAHCLSRLILRKGDWVRFLHRFAPCTLLTKT